MFGRGLLYAIHEVRDLVRARDHAVLRDLAVERQRRIDAERRADIAQNNFEWSRVRLNQIEQERAVLLQTLLKAPIGALEIERRLTPDEGVGMPHGLPDGLFDDIGDDVAHALGLVHDDQGAVRTKSNG